MTTNSNNIELDGKIKAAYALNLCTVSVSQIIDYNDFNILDQEYDVILNNLNLEAIPKDEALLHVLKQILDTITYFRIDEVERKMVDEEYQSEMQNAIWNAIPSFGVLLMGANPSTIIASLASQVGIAYINYRRNKADALKNKEKSIWRLQKSAIEQFNGLRRELFDTAWKLADSYQFPDFYRLTENQIQQYNDILMDTDLIRRFERLETIKNNFIAYPPFWYFFGHTAAEIYFDHSLRLTDTDRKYYFENAKSSYQIFYDSRKFNLLRVNHIAAAGALEYSDLLDKEKDKELIKQLICYAIEQSGNANDVLQLCAISLLRIEEYEKATTVLNILVNEEYNTKTNAQILSGIYVRMLMDKTDEFNVLRKYNLLSQRVNKQYLYQVPKSTLLGYDLKSIEMEFLDNQKEVSKKEFESVMNEYIEKKTSTFNKIIPLPTDEENPETREYLYSYYGTGDRINHAKTWLLNDNNSNDFKHQLCNINYAGEIINVLNVIFDDIQDMTFISDKMREMLWQNVRIKLTDCGGKVDEIIKAFHTQYRYTIDNYLELESLTLDTFTGEMFENLSEYVCEYIDNLHSVSELSDFEYILQKFCMKQDISSPEELIASPTSRELIVDNDIFTVEMLGSRATNENERSQIISDMLTRINLQKGTLLNVEGRNGGAKVYLKNTMEFDRYFAENHLNKGRNNQSYDALAVIDDKFAFNQDLVLTDQMVKIVSFGKVAAAAGYDAISITSDRKKLKIGNKQYSSKNVVIDSLWILIKELRELSRPLDSLKPSKITTLTHVDNIQKGNRLHRI